ncbi:MAG: trichohyalin-plectin-homology domain domain-containing protein [Treponema sp.]|nr:trichohyalin-plectin-homology domain domain-containing protein [Treponema sp.]
MDSIAAGFLKRVFFLTCLILFFWSPAGKTAAAPKPGTLEPNKGRDDVNVAVLPTGLENADDIPWAASLVANQINTVLNNFSEVKLLSRDQNTLNQIQKELEFQLSHGSETNSPSLGEFANGEYMITSKIVKTGRTVYNLQMEFIQLQQGERGTIRPVIIAVNNGFYSQDDIRNNSAVKIALNNMFPDMGIILTGAGLAELLAGIQINKVQARTAMAQAEDADFAGNSFDSLFYKNRAKQLDSSIGKGFLKQSKAEEELLGVGTGTAIADDAAAQERWKQNILKMEKLFVDHPPFAIYYTPNPKQFGNTDYASGTASLEFNISLRRGVDLRVAQTMLNDVSQGLQKTGNKRKWGFDGWPQSPIQTIYNPEKIPHFEGLRPYLVTADLVNDRDEIIQSQTFPLYSQLRLSGSKIGADSTQRLRVVFPNVPVENTSNTHVKISSINGYQELGKERGSGENTNEFIQLVPVKRIPLKQAPSIAKKERRVEAVTQFPALIPPPPSGPPPVPAAVNQTAAEAPEEAGAEGESAGPQSMADLARQRQARAEQDELAQRQEELARQQEEFNRQQQYIEEQEAIEREKREIAQRQQQAAENAKRREQELKEQERRRKQEERRARNMAVPLHNRFGFGAMILTDMANFDLLSIKGDLEIGIANVTLEGVFAAPVNQNIYDIPGADHDRVINSGLGIEEKAENNFVFGLGGGLGYTFYSNYFLGTLTAGVNHWTFVDQTYINMPYTQIKLDILPFKKGLSLRLGYLVEGAALTWGDKYTRYFKDRWTNKAGNFRFYNRFQAGLAFWI